MKDDITPHKGYKPKPRVKRDDSIEAYGGIKNFLDAKKYNGYGYDDYIKNYNLGVNIANLGHMFGVGWSTSQKWLKLITAEHPDDLTR